MSIAADCQRASDRNDIMERIRLDFKFHQVLVELSGNQVFTDIQEQLTKKGRLIQIQHYSENGATFCNLAGHLDILQALNDRNTNACIKAMQDHLRPSYASHGVDSKIWEVAETALRTTDVNNIEILLLYSIFFLKTKRKPQLVLLQAVVFSLYSFSSLSAY